MNGINNLYAIGVNGICVPLVQKTCACHWGKWTPEREKRLAGSVITNGTLFRRDVIGKSDIIPGTLTDLKALPKHAGLKITTRSLDDISYCVKAI